MTPFEMLDTDIDKFFMMCNYLCNLGERRELHTQADEANEKEEAADFWAAL